MTPGQAAYLLAAQDSRRGAAGRPAREILWAFELGTDGRSFRRASDEVFHGTTGVPAGVAADLTADALKRGGAG